VRVIDVRPAVVLAGEAGQFDQRRAIAVHREHAVRHEERPPKRRPFAPQERLERVDVAVWIHVNRRARQSTSIDHRGVIERVREYGVSTAHECRERSDIGGVPAGKQQRRGRSKKGGKGALERRVFRMVPNDQSRRGGPDSVALDRVAGGASDAGV